MELDDLVALASGEYPAEALEAAEVAIAHNLAAAASARVLVGDLLEEPERWDGGHIDLHTGRRVDIPSAITRNAQLIHALCQDDTHFGAMTHVGTTALPLLFALGEASGATTRDLIAGFAAAISAAEVLGAPVSPGISQKGIRPTSVMGPTAAVVGAGRMLGWEPFRLRRAVARVASSSYGTQQTWVEGSQDWLYQVAAVGLLAWHAARSSAAPWVAASEPFWGAGGLFTSMGVTRPRQEAGPAREPDPRGAAVRIRLKRFPVCAINQVPLTLLAEVIAEGGKISAVETRMAPAFAQTAGIDRSDDLDSPTRRLMSTPYCVAVMAGKGDFVVQDLARQPDIVTEGSIRAMSVTADESVPLGEFVLRVQLADGRTTERRGDSTSVGEPTRCELDRAARRVAGIGLVDTALELLDRGDTSVSDLLAAVTRA